MKIKEIIEKLKNTDIESLKNIDIEQVKEILKTRPDILINVILAILIIILPILIHNKNKMTINTLKKGIRGNSPKNWTLLRKATASRKNTINSSKTSPGLCPVTI